MRRRTLVQALVVAGVVVLVGGTGAAAACKFAFDCHLRPSYDAAGEALKPTTGEVVLPQGFTSVPVASELNQPVAFDFLPDGRILVGERAGLVRLVEDGRLSDLPVVDLREQVNTEFFRGLVALAVDPDFEINGFFYVVYSVRQPERDPKASTVVRLSRFALTEASAGREEVILGADGDRTNSCTALPPTADCLPSDLDHIGADIAFAEDGTLFVSTGDGGGLEEVEKTAFRALDVNSLGGKILRVTRDGRGLASNPFFAGDTTANRSKVWAVGLRNPFRLTLTRGGLPVVGDVGWKAADEIDVAPAGASLGWPCFEGEGRTMEYKATALCKTLYQKEAMLLRRPVITLPHPDGSSVTGGVFYEGDSYPERYRGSYFFGDWGRSWIRRVHIDPQSGETDGEPVGFARNAGGPVAFRIGPDELVYVLSLNHGELRRISYASP